MSEYLGNVVIRSEGDAAQAWAEVTDSSGNYVVEYCLDHPLSTALDHLESVQAHQVVIEARLLGAVAAARASGASWAVIGRSLGVTKQSAQAKYGRLIS